jgi:hypothetical protein
MAKNRKFDNDPTMKVIMAKDCSKRNGTEQLSCPNDFVDQLSKRKKPSFEHPLPFVLRYF